jgi:hypothetical protein
MHRRDGNRDGQRHDGHRPPTPPAPPHGPDFRGSQTDAPLGHLTSDDSPESRQALDRLASLERSLSRLAEQINQLQNALR